jgi:hypothetical protein
MVCNMRSVLALVVVSAACAPAPASPQPYSPSEVTELASVPEGYVAGASLTESCAPAPRGAFEDEALSDVDCGPSRLSQALRARAGEQGARFVFGKRCRASDGPRPRLSCTASLLHPTDRVPLDARATAGDAPAPSAAQVMELDEPRPQDAARIRVTFRAASDGPVALPARAYHNVEETARASVGRRVLGQVSARCEAACDAGSLRHALRVTAGRVGAGELSGVVCFEEGDGSRCVATALVPWSS